METLPHMANCPGKKSETRYEENPQHNPDRRKGRSCCSVSFKTTA
jgi:hypothetical protein